MQLKDVLPVITEHYYGSFEKRSAIIICYRYSVEATGGTDSTSMAVKLHNEIFNEIQLNLITHFANEAGIGMGPLIA